MALLKLRKTEPGEPLIAAMTAVRMGDRLLIIGCGAAKVIAQIAARPGVPGRACAVDDDAGRTARAAAAAQREGALLDGETASFSAWPFERYAFDVVVINPLLPRLERSQREPCVAEAVRVVRGGGRCVVVQAG